MAIKCTYKFSGLIIPGAYVRVQRIFGGKHDGGWQSLVNVYASDTAALAGDDPIQTLNVGITYTANIDPYGPIYGSIHTYLDALGIVDAVDC